MKTYIAELKHGRFILLEKDFVCDMANFYGEWSEKELDLFRTILMPGDVVIEAGSHVGLHTVPLARLVEPSGIVIALEPQQAFFNALCGNIALNNLLNVQVERVAVGESLGRASMPGTDYEYPTNYGNLTILGDAGGNIPMVTISHLAAEKPVKLIKIDVEGAAFLALKGCEQIVSRDRPYIFVEYFEQDDRIIETVRDFGYRPFWFCVPGFNPDNYRRIKHNVFIRDGTLLGDFNLFCVPKEADRFPDFLLEAGSGQDIADNKVMWVIDVEEW